MAYSLNDVDAAEALIRKLRPDAIISRDDFDWSLSVKDKDSEIAIILFQNGDEGRPERISTEEEIRDICFLMGSQWTAEEALRLARKWPGGFQ